MKKFVILIPVYNPDGCLIRLISSLIQENFSKIIIVNDGSDIKYEPIFSLIKEIDNCILLEYKTNQGKGHALKYGIDYYLKHLSKTYQGIITTDADFQHSVKDIINIENNFKKDDKFILGVRNFQLKNIPINRKLGNRLTSFLFYKLYHTKVADTQSGLRLFTNSSLKKCLKIAGDRFEYEMMVLINFSKERLQIKQIPIETIYFKVKSSKFKIIRDSYQIYKTLFQNIK